MVVLLNELKMLWMEAVVSYFKALFLNFPLRTDEIHETSVTVADIPNEIQTLQLLTDRRIT
jgi:hypothetical protein